MRIVKLDRRYTINRFHNFEIGLQFYSYSKEARLLEKACQNTFGNKSWDWTWRISRPTTGTWTTHMGRKVGNNPRPYWIYLRKESMVTMLKLATDWSEYE